VKWIGPILVMNFGVVVGRPKVPGEDSSCLNTHVIAKLKAVGA